MIQVETFRESFCCCFWLRVLLVGYLLFSEVEKTSKDVRLTLRSQCKEMFPVPEGNVIKGHGESDGITRKKD